MSDDTPRHLKGAFIMEPGLLASEIAKRRAAVPARNKSRVIIAGTRDANPDTVRALLRRGFDRQGLTPADIEAIATGESGTVDKIGRIYAEYHGLDYRPFPADWDKHGRAAGSIRNLEMAKWAAEVEDGTLVAVWDGKSRGTQDMILNAHRAGLIVEVQILTVEASP